MHSQSIESYLADLGAKTSTPGGGAAAALTAAQGAALIEMLAHFSLEKSSEETVDWNTVCQTMQERRKKFLQLAEDDQKAFEAVTLCYQLDRKDPSRQSKMNVALHGAAEPPLQVIESSWGILQEIEPWLKAGNANIISDGGIAITLFEAAIAASEFNVLINYKFIKDEQMRSLIKNRLDQVSGSYRKICESMTQIVKQRI